MEGSFGDKNSLERAWKHKTEGTIEWSREKESLGLSTLRGREGDDFERD
jgi:hypothetical protein